MAAAPDLAGRRAANCRLHCRRRLAQRYGLALDPGDIGALEWRIKNGRAEFVRNAPGGRAVVRLRLARRYVYLVYDVALGCVVTALLPGRAGGFVIRAAKRCL